MSREKSPKPPYHVGVKQAMRTGWRAEEFAPDSRPNRRARVARAVASAIRLNPTLGEFRRAEKAHQTMINARLEKAKASAQGANRKVLDMLEHSVNLPSDLPANTVSEPMSGNYTTDVSPNGSFKLRSFQSELSYRRDFAVNGARPSNPGWGTAYLNTADGKPLTVTVQMATGNPMQIPVNNVSISYRAPATVVGERYNTEIDTVGAGVTTVSINTRAYDPDNTRMYVGRGPSTRVNEDGSPDGQVRFTIGDDGQLSTVSLGRNNADSMQPASGATVDVHAFLNQMNYAIFDTNSLAQAPNDLSSLN